MIKDARSDQGYKVGAVARKNQPISSKTTKLNLIERMPFFMAGGRAGRK